MAIQLPQGLQINAKQAVDTRLLMSKAMMKAQDDNLMPIRYFTVCVEDGNLYLYSKDNEIDETLGRFRPLMSNVEEDIETIKANIDLINDLIAGKQDVLTAGKGIEIIQDSEGRNIINSLLDLKELEDLLPTALRNALAAQDANSGLDVDENGNIKVNLNSDFLKINDDNQITLEEGILLQAIENN